MRSCWAWSGVVVVPDEVVDEVGEVGAGVEVVCAGAGAGVAGVRPPSSFPIVLFEPVEGGLPDRAPEEAPAGELLLALDAPAAVAAPVDCCLLETVVAAARLAAEAVQPVWVGLAPAGA